MLRSNPSAALSETSKGGGVTGAALFPSMFPQCEKPSTLDAWSSTQAKDSQPRFNSPIETPCQSVHFSLLE